LRELEGDQAMVGPGETVSYAFSLNKAKLQPGQTYVVRFVVFVLYLRLYLRPPEAPPMRVGRPSQSQSRIRNPMGPGNPRLCNDPKPGD
jgi:hypothetical protein